MILNEIKCYVNTSLGLVEGCIPCIPPVSAPAANTYSVMCYPLWLRILYSCIIRLCLWYGPRVCDKI